ncbi:TBC1 domain family member [Paramyrothecium foliicola]|nr:TBC1 domain family member [Paramyrothecium foliicola]
MRPPEETLRLWQETRANYADIDHLRREVKSTGSANPCVSGCRSACWKAFLLSKEKSWESWHQRLRTSRKGYARQREHFLKYIKHPEALAEVTIDPLADDPESPWNTVRQDEVIRAEILQDVQRLPDEANYHNDRIQSMILDILFVYCKQYPARGGYRQGMHELLAPLVHVIEQDSIDAAALHDESSRDDLALEMLDANFVEHDAYALFSQLMESAQAFYEAKSHPGEHSNDGSVSRRVDQSSAIVERSKFIHEVCLQKVDPELAAHLSSVEVLPQIFLIRWIRLLFSREFPFNQFLVLWDTIFAIDPSLDLIDLMCVSMLIRIRWQLLEADYSVCLQLLLKYPPPSEDHGPHTFVDDAVYLRDNLHPSGGFTLITKYTGRSPDAVKSPTSPTPAFPSLGSFRQKSFNRKSPLPSPSRFIQQQGGMEALFQNAAKGAKGVIERGEKLGINQAVRDAMGEIRRNVQAFNETRTAPLPIGGSTLNDEGAASALAAMQRRNMQLANMLNETVANLKMISTSDPEDKAKNLELIEIAAAKVQFVQIYLEDSSMEMPVLDSATLGEAQPEVADVVHGGSDDESVTKEPEPVVKQGSLETETSSKVDEKALSSDPEAPDAVPPTDSEANESSAGGEPQKDPLQDAKVAIRPAPIPTRSTLAQSSFSWMLEPDQSMAAKSLHETGKKSPTHQRKRGNNASREKNAFLFGDVVPETEGNDPLSNDDIFGMQPLQKPKAKP